ncbi:MAG: hypothetical protein HC809_12115 [Gammaproteobacteria bacterium]|nr:hypothetical protein [Gammaproteobacteria bacterium]
MSITTALALGFDTRFCAAGCARTQPSPLFASASEMPYTELGVRPAMLVAAGSIAATTALIDRGLTARADPRGALAYLVTAGDANRDIRGAAFRRLAASPPPGVIVRTRQGFSPIDFSATRSATLFYFTGAVRVLHRCVCLRARCDR